MPLDWDDEGDQCNRCGRMYRGVCAADPGTGAAENCPFALPVLPPLDMKAVVGNAIDCEPQAEAQTENFAGEADRPALVSAGRVHGREELCVFRFDKPMSKGQLESIFNFLNENWGGVSL